MFKMIFLRVKILSIILFFYVLISFADEVKLKSGRVIKGEIISQDEKKTVILCNGVNITINNDEILSVQKETISTYPTTEVTQPQDSNIFSDIKLPIPCYCGVPIITEKGRWIFRGAVSKNSWESIVLVTDNECKTWNVIKKPPVVKKGSWCTNIYPSPHSDSTMLAGLGGNSDLIITEDSGATWRVIMPLYASVANEKPKQVGSAFWSLPNPREVIVSLVDGTFACINLDSNQVQVISKLDDSASKYVLIDGRHYVRLGAWDTYNCRVSADDGKTWQKIPVEDTPWNLESKVFNKIDLLLPERGKYLKTQFERDNMGSYVKWIEFLGSENILFCQISRMQGESDYTMEGMFFSENKGETWIPIIPDNPQAGLARLFTAPQFVCSKKDSPQKWINVPSVAYDKDRDIIFASSKGICYITTSKGTFWTAINHLPEEWNK